MRIPIESTTSYRGRNSRPNWFVFLGFVGSALAIGALGALFAPGFSANTAAWYASLAKPAWVPPSNWFAPVWATLYVLMGTAAWRIWEERYHRGRNPALAAYLLQLLLNAAWAPAFFGAHSIGAGLFINIALTLAIIWTIRRFAPVKALCAWMLVPYLAWVAFAASLNYSIWQLNP
jgi:tryptophan-rich sensory protein